MMRKLLIVLAVMSLSVLPVAEAPGDVIICDGPSLALLTAGASQERATDVFNKMSDLCLFSSISLASVDPTPPTFEYLQQHDVALFWSEVPLADPVGLGDALADYVDSGHRLVIAYYGFIGSSRPTGRLASGGYYPFTTAPTSIKDGPFGLVADEPSSSLLDGVASVNCLGGCARGDLEVAEGAKLIAHWNDPDATPFVAIKGSVVGLNFYPPSSTTLPGMFWDATTDGDVLMANALRNANPVDIKIRAPGRIPKGRSAAVSGRVFGVDPCVSRVGVELMRGGSRVASDTTDAGGAYRFSLRITRTMTVRTITDETTTCQAGASARRTIRAT